MGWNQETGGWDTLMRNLNLKSPGGMYFGADWYAMITIPIVLQKCPLVADCYINWGLGAWRAMVHTVHAYVWEAVMNSVTTSSNHARTHVPWLPFLLFPSSFFSPRHNLSPLVYLVGMISVSDYHTRYRLQHGQYQVPEARCKPRWNVVLDMVDISRSCKLPNDNKEKNSRDN